MTSFRTLPSPRLAGALLLAVAAAVSAAAQEPVQTLDRFLVHATHTAEPDATNPGTVDIFTAEDLARTPNLALDDALKQSPAFSLFRRSGSLTANPTAQGVSLRGLGPSGASRSLVLLDGVPLNDPFGGWVAWSKILPATLQEVRIVRGSSANSWGSAALGGSVELLSRAIRLDQASVAGALGDFGTGSGDFLVDRQTTAGGVRVAGAVFATDGVPLVAAENRGAIDRDADARHQAAQLDWRTALNASTSLTVEARAFAETRGNGTPLQQNQSRETFLSATLAGRSAALPAWSGVVYAQRQGFESFFSSVAANRATETPASNQYDVPATAGGLAFTGSWGAGPDQTTTAGIDARWVEGETREAFLFSAATGDFTRRRFAGGAQSFAGGFVHQTLALAPHWSLSADARLDYWRNAGGHRREIDAGTGAVLRDDHYAARDGVEFSPGLGVVAQLTSRLRFHASAFRAFRLPTLNEFYRPFRVGAVTTEANPDLGLETNTGGELGLEATPGAFTFSLAPFFNALDGAVTNTTTSPNQRQRQNLARVVVQGVESAVEWRHKALQIRAGYLGTDARVDRARGTAAALVGRRLPQVPRHTVTGSVRWTVEKLTLGAQFRWTSAQFEDDENLLPLAAAVVVDLQAAYRVGNRGEAFLAIENLGDTRVETGRSADGLVNVGPPRWARGGVRWSF